MKIIGNLFIVIAAVISAVGAFDVGKKNVDVKKQAISDQDAAMSPYYQDQKEARATDYELTVKSEWNKIPCDPKTADSGCGNLRCVSARSDDATLSKLYSAVGAFCLPERFCGSKKNGLSFECSGYGLRASSLVIALVLYFQS